MRINIGRRTAAFIATGAVALTGAGVAHAGIQNEYSGTVEGDQEPGYIGLDVNRVEDKRVVENVNAGTEITCRGGVSPINYTSGSLPGRITVKKDDTFEATRRWNSNFGGTQESTIKLEGKVVSRDVVRGTLRIVEFREDGVSETCRTGERRFRATRPEMN
ncbi:hypothetical protein HJD18_10200 [Thermoleophilia bacterium SCSIO 60948]|nr:hypothetical protein HJD18_10200 [Thermoleophilia bacterium SCSIO 60948]